MVGHWPHSFLRFYGARLRLDPSTREKELGQYPAVLTSRLVNNTYYYSLLSSTESEAMDAWVHGKANYSWTSDYMPSFGARPRVDSSEIADRDLSAKQNPFSGLF